MIRICIAVALWLLAGPVLAQSCWCIRCLTTGERSFYLPAGHMKPTLEPGQCFVARMGEGRSLDIKPGDIVLFRHPVQGVDHVFRVIALGGQTVQITDGLPVVDGAPLVWKQRPPYREVMEPQGPQAIIPRCAGPVAGGESCLIPRATEVLANGVSYDILDIDPNSAADHTPLFAVPADHIFVLGDNRDNSLDSRFATTQGGPGFIPLDNVFGVMTGLLE